MFLRDDEKIQTVYSYGQLLFSENSSSILAVMHFILFYLFFGSENNHAFDV
jgi:hypothetical protein